MSKSTVPTVANGDSWTAAQHNTYLRDNIAAIWVGTTAGDMDYYTGAVDKARLALVVAGLLYGGASAPTWLAKPASLGLLKNDGAGALAWLTGGSALQVLRKDAANTGYEFSHVVGALDTIGLATRTSAVELTNEAYADISGLSVTITLSVPCTIVALLTGLVASNNYGGAVRLLIDGTAQPAGSEAGMTSQGAQWPLAVSWFRTGMAAGARIIKAQNDCAGSSMYVQGNLIALAFKE